jgi:hypothetical protein
MVAGAARFCFSNGGTNIIILVRGSRRAVSGLRLRKWFRWSHKTKKKTCIVQNHAMTSLS